MEKNKSFLKIIKCFKALRFYYQLMRSIEGRSPLVCLVQAFKCVLGLAVRKMFLVLASRKIK